MEGARIFYTIVACEGILGCSILKVTFCSIPSTYECLLFAILVKQEATISNNLYERKVTFSLLMVRVYWGKMIKSGLK